MVKQGTLQEFGIKKKRGESKESVWTNKTLSGISGIRKPAHFCPGFDVFMPRPVCIRI